MSNTRRATFISAFVVGILAVVVSLLVSAGWGLIFLEVAGLILILVLFVREQAEEGPSEQVDEE
ncbi:MAG: hypothetical protein M3203_11410 [Actinomycetota bacterium]|nr:hypothetical protein [Actinomycetota bacterium]